MAALKEIARQQADVLRDGIAWVIVWKVGRSWKAEEVWLNPETDLLEAEDVATVAVILAADPNAVMLNGYFCGHLGEDRTLAELAEGIRWHYEAHTILLKDLLLPAKSDQEESGTEDVLPAEGNPSPSEKEEKASAIPSSRLKKTRKFPMVWNRRSVGFGKEEPTDCRKQDLVKKKEKALSNVFSFQGIPPPYPCFFARYRQGKKSTVGNERLKGGGTDVTDGGI